jgi:hypothetical protein
MQYLIFGLHRTDAVVRFCDVCVAEFIPPLCDCCLFVVTALLFITWSMNKWVVEQTTQLSQQVKWLFFWLGFLSDFTQAPLLDGLNVHW